ncbi:hypothetical protein [Calothrix sp. NIES-2098]|uniref:hypothetical protein n=1 Tax=Calothrix sp. NIES-2098 TaxID=1954171 RepID=UPI0030D804A4
MMSSPGFELRLCPEDAIAFILAFGCCSLIVTVSHTHSLTFDAVGSCAQTMRTENFFCFWSSICAGACLCLVFVGLAVHGDRGNGSFLWFISTFYKSQRFPLTCPF